MHNEPPKVLRKCYQTHDILTLMVCTASTLA